MDPKPRDYASSDDELVVEDVTKPPAEEDASDMTAPTAAIDAAADSDDDRRPCARPKMTNGRRGGRPGSLPRNETPPA